MLSSSWQLPCQSMHYVTWRFLSFCTNDSAAYGAVLSLLQIAVFKESRIGAISPCVPGSKLMQFTGVIYCCFVSI